MPIGFAGGHGTAAALAQAFADVGYPEGKDVALGTATIGLLSSVTVGILLVNVASRKKWVQYSRMQTGTDIRDRQGLTNPDSRPVAGLQTVSGDSIDSMAWHLVIVGIAILFGYAVKVILIQCDKKMGESFPLFPLAMLAGLCMQLALQRFDTSKKLVDHNTMSRISGTSLDFLIVGAIASVDVYSLGHEWEAFLVICVSGILWEVVCVLFVSPIMHPTHWFEGGICCYGQDTGVIAAGLMLLKMVDPESKTPIPAAFGYKQPLHSAIMGGGIVTALFINVQNSLSGGGAKPKVGLWGSAGGELSSFLGKSSTRLPHLCACHSAGCLLPRTNVPLKQYNSAPSSTDETPFPRPSTTKVCLAACIIILVIWFFTLRPGFQAIRKADKERRGVDADDDADSELLLPRGISGDNGDVDGDETSAAYDAIPAEQDQLTSIQAEMGGIRP